LRRVDASPGRSAAEYIAPKNGHQGRPARLQLRHRAPRTLAGRAAPEVDGTPLGAARDEAGREARRLTKPHTPPSGLRRLIPLTLAEIRRLLHLDRHDKHATAHGLHWSNWRRGHQAAARRAHFRRHLRLQMNVI
jgi:hypothetical protein